MLSRHPDDFYEEAKKAHFMRAKGRRVQMFLGNLWAFVIEEAPKWAALPDVSFNFSKSEKFIREYFPTDCSDEEFVDNLVSFAIPQLRSGTYPTRAHAGWLVAVLANVLSEKGQQNIILQHAVTKIWDELTKKGPIDVVGDLFNPPLLNGLRETLQPAFLDRVVNFMWDHIRNQDYFGFNIYVDAHLLHGHHLGIYNFENEKTRFARGLLAKYDASQLVTSIKETGFAHRIIFLINFMERLPPEQKQRLALELDKKIGCEAILDELNIVMRGRYEIPGEWAGVRLFTRLISSLPEQQKNVYADRLIKHFGADTLNCIARQVKWLGSNEVPSEFIASLPAHLAVPFVRSLVKKALNADYYAKDGDYGDGPNCYNNRINFATSLHDAIPRAYLSVYEDAVIEFLEWSPVDKRNETLLKASLLMRTPLTREGDFRTEEIDFYVIRNLTNDALAHIKPHDGLPSLLTADQFIGSLADFEANVTRTESLGPPRWLPPHQRSLYPSQRYAVLIPNLRAAEQVCLADLCPRLPTLLEVLHARQPMPGRALPRSGSRIRSSSRQIASAPQTAPLP
jgi:hypothetical protein